MKKNTRKQSAFKKCHHASVWKFREHTLELLLELRSAIGARAEFSVSQVLLEIKQGIMLSEFRFPSQLDNVENRTKSGDSQTTSLNPTCNLLFGQFKNKNKTKL